MAQVYLKAVCSILCVCAAGLSPAGAGEVSRRTAERLEAVNPEAVKLALEDMAATWPDRCPIAKSREWLESLPLRRGVLLMKLRADDESAVLDALLLLGEVRSALLANPLLDFDRLFVLRRGFLKSEARAMPKAWQGTLGVGDLNAHSSDTIPRTGHWKDAFVEWTGLRTGVQERVIYEATDTETLIEPDVHFDGRRILFAKNGAAEKNWRLWEVNADGTGLRQVSPDDGVDIGHFDPCYLPNGDIVFASTASYQGLPCEFGGREMVCLYRLNPATKAVRQLTFEQDSDWTPAVMPDGRVMYLRWEYTDQSHANSRILFSMNPDGTDQREVRGSGSWFPGAFFSARSIPGPENWIIGVAGGHHDVPRSGRLLIFDPAAGRRDGAGIVQEIPGRGKRVDPVVRDGLILDHLPQFLHPYPLSGKYHIVSMKGTADGLWGVYLVDVFDNLTLIHEEEGAACLEPIPLRAVTPPPAIPDRVNLATNTATVHIHDLYAGPGLAGIPRGTVRKLRVIEYYFSRRGMGGLYGTLGMDGPWDVKRILGTVPVDAEGSAYFTVPANSPIAIQPLDDKGQAVQLMRSWMTAMPGERLSCVGCHESQNMAPRADARVLARAPDAIAPWYGPPRGFSFVREVQPVLDRHCVGCHDGSGAVPPAESAKQPSNVRRPPDFRGGIPLTNWVTSMAGHWGGGGRFTTSYAALHRYLRRPGIEGDRRMFTPMDYHFSQTELGQLLRKGHHGVNLDAESFERLAAWHDLNAPFFGTWGEIPPFDQGRKPKKNVTEAMVDRANARYLELRRAYVPMGPFTDYEAILETPAYDPALPPPVEAIEPPPADIACEGWPFDAKEAARRQSDTAPAGTDGKLKLTLTVPVPEPVAAPVRGRYLRVNAGPAQWLSIAEAEVFCGGRNVALDRPARQSSTTYSGHPGLAVDGNTDGFYAQGSITHTGNGTGEWWEVELPANAGEIDRIVLWNRTDGAPERLADCGIEIQDENRKTVWSARTPASVGRKIVLGVSRPASELALDFAWIPPGEFVMGGLDGAPDERPRHRARMEKGFWMSRVEISNEAFKQFAPMHESRTEDRHGYQFGITGYDQDQPDQPAVRVSWNEAMVFCRWLSARSGRRVTLPTEAQWEWACRAGTETPFWFGGYEADFSKKANLGDAMLAYFSGDPYTQDYRKAWYKNADNPFDNWIPQDARFNDDGFVTEPVGRYDANPWGLHDMHGNAWEWTRSVYRPYPATDGGGQNDPPAGADEQRVVRGGSWYDRPFKCTSSHRMPYAPWQKVYNVGFRVIIE